MCVHLDSTTAHPLLMQLEWDKGTALIHLLGCMELADAEQVFALYIGDDRTDEDAFKGELAWEGGEGGPWTLREPTLTRGPPLGVPFGHQVPAPAATLMWTSWHSTGTLACLGRNLRSRLPACRTRSFL